MRTDGAQVCWGARARNLTAESLGKEASDVDGGDMVEDMEQRTDDGERTDGGPGSIVTHDDNGLSPGTTFVAISAGGDHTCGLGRMGQPSAGVITSMANRLPSKESLPPSVPDSVIPARSGNRATWRAGVSK